MKLLILDKDGTLVRPKAGAKFVQNPQDQELLPGVAEAVSRYAAEGWAMVIASNQGGVIAGYKTLEEALAEMRFALELTNIPKSYFCPDGGRYCYEQRLTYGEFCFSKYDRLACEMERFDSFRKPGQGMIQLATDFTYGMLADEVLFVGDRPEDEQAAQNAGVKFMWADAWRKGAEALV